jgi:hypothetical protein
MRLYFNTTPFPGQIGMVSARTRRRRRPGSGNLVDLVNTQSGVYQQHA